MLLGRHKDYPPNSRYTSSATPAVITSTTDVLIPGMSVTLANDGDFKIEFSTSVVFGQNNDTVWVSIYHNGVQVADSERVTSGAGSGDSRVLSINTEVKGAAVGDTIEARARVGTNDTANIQQRGLNVLFVVSQ